MGVFNFKYFSLCDDRAAMKVGTDAVLLGAWAELKTPGTILDIGSGSGVIALMAAQRTGNETHIDAVEIQLPDVEQLTENVTRSPWSGRISVFQSAIQDFDSKSKYQYILCNPPFFSKSLLPPAKKRTLARHDVTLSQHDLLDVVWRLLAPEGAFSIILPYEHSEKFAVLAGSRGLVLSRHTRFFSRKEKNPERSLMEFRHFAPSLQINDLVLYQNEDVWTPEYRELTKDFYLDR